jgi:hypothetical protein
MKLRDVSSITFAKRCHGLSLQALCVGWDLESLITEWKTPAIPEE